MQTKLIPESWSRSGILTVLAALYLSPAAHAAPPQVPTVDAVLAEPRRIAAAIVAAEGHAPHAIVQVGAHHGEFLAVFLEQFPESRGLWTEPHNDEPNLPAAKQYLARFGDRVQFRYGCGDRDFRAGCLPPGTDVILTDWMSVLQNLDGIYQMYRIAADTLPAGGWLINIDQVGFGSSDWDARLDKARSGLRPPREAPPVHHPDFRTPTAEEQLGAMRAAGLDAQLVWQSFNTVLLMGHKR